ncbi:hypothetical protein PtA15_1A667 [Puccinia triticina]|uniref:Uncharacterized protein n=1 Tax=Puccinia triticina TaxID=208348 RepID=A0ABY7CER7_9BASI|nr:uncharacterized protein PtA15_1A667 [Puccinia triticina]WAQ81327.1 hypothetical protein PtA15_1A667 [Puccinia triticina]
MFRGLSKPLFLYHALIICHIGIMSIKPGLCSFGSRLAIAEPSFSSSRTELGCAGRNPQQNLLGVADGWTTKRARSKPKKVHVVPDRLDPPSQLGRRPGRSRRVRPGLSDSSQSGRKNELKTVLPDGLVKNRLWTPSERPWPTRKRSRRPQKILDQKPTNKGIDPNDALPEINDELKDNSRWMFSPDQSIRSLPSPGAAESATGEVYQNSPLDMRGEPKINGPSEGSLVDDDVEAAPARKRFQQHAPSSKQSHVQQIHSQLVSAAPPQDRDGNPTAKFFDLNNLPEIDGHLENHPGCFSPEVQLQLIRPPPPQRDVESATEKAPLTSHPGTPGKPGSNGLSEGNLLEDDDGKSPLARKIKVEGHASWEKSVGSHLVDIDLNIPLDRDGRPTHNSQSH